MNPANNQIVGQTYDANGNQTSPPNGSGQLVYDAENRLIQNYVNVQYAYDSQNKRVWAGTLVSNTLTGQSASLYGIDGQKLGTSSLSVTSTQFTVTATSLSVYFAGKRVAIVAGVVINPYVQDRLGSNMSGAEYPVSLYPWGEDRGTPAPNGQIKFATYTRDSSTLLDYADQRYYSNQFGRFATPDPYQASGGPADSQSWNRYAYTRGDPVNRVDPAGTCDQSADTDYSITVCADTSDIGLYSGITVTQSGAYAHGLGSEQSLIQALLGMVAAREALLQFATTKFSAKCESFIDNALGPDALAIAQKDALETSVVNAAGVFTPAGTTLFPTSPGYAEYNQGIADQATGLPDASLAQWALVSPTIYAWGQWKGNTIFINNASTWMGFGSAYAMYTIFHEMLHVAGLGGDTQLAADLGISPATLKAVGSIAITYKLMAECGN